MEEVKNEPKEMNLDDAFNIVNQASSAFVGNRNDHILVANALNMIKALIESSKPKKE